MKRVKQLVLLTAIAVLSFIALSCTPDDSVEEQREDCNCTKYYYTVTFQVNSSGTGFVPVHTLTDQEEVCEEAATSVYYDDLKYYNVLCD